jgi:hypothetical protein
LERQTKPICKYRWEGIDIIQLSNDVGYQLALECRYCGERKEEVVYAGQEVNA